MKKSWISMAVLATGSVIASANGCGPRLPVNVSPDLAMAKSLRTALEAGGGEGASTDSATTPSAMPTGWATLSGVFRIAGDRPSAATLSVDKDQGVCAPGGKQVLSQEFVISPEGGIGNVLVFVSQKLPDDEPWTHPDAKPGKADEVIFDQKECVFLTRLLAIQSSQPIRIKNSDPVGHNTSLKPKKNPAYDQTIPSNAAGLYQPKAEEDQPFPVACAIHPWMKAYMITRKNSYFAVTKPDGSFEIPNLPAGVELEFRVWQEKTNFLQDVTVNGTSEKWGKGRFKRTLTPGETTKLEVQVAGTLFQ
ncbi:MAG: hypothetical protein ACKO38_08460 [Planctomycetota bacterium]